MEVNSGEPYLWENAEGYDTRIVDAETFWLNLHPGLSDVSLSWSFARGDMCAANFFEGVIIGFAFSATKATRVTDKVEFNFPEKYVYGYGDFTHSEHRGKRLARDRWKTSREARLTLGRDPRTIFYINVLNESSLRANISVPGQTPSILLGYSAHCKIGDRAFCWCSSGARAAGTGFKTSQRIG